MKVKERMDLSLFKRCPRCGRLGRVYMEAYEDDQIWFRVLWEGQSRNLHRGKHDQDSLLTQRDLFSPEFGCGYDKAGSAVKAEPMTEKLPELPDSA